MNAVLFPLLVLLLAPGAGATAGAGGFGGYALGLTWPGLSDLQQRLEAHGFQVPATAVTQGGGGYGFGHGWIIGGFGFGGSLTAEGNGETAEISLGGGGVEMGRIWHLGPVWTALTGFLGGYGLDLTVRPDLGSVDFDSLLAHPRRIARLSTGSLLAGLGVLGILPVTSWFHLGFRAHLALTPLGSWRLEDGADLHNAPDPSRWHTAVQVMFLFGGLSPGTS